MNTATLLASMVISMGIVFVGVIVGIALVRYWLYKHSDYEKDFYQDKP